MSIGGFVKIDLNSPLMDQLRFRAKQVEDIKLAARSGEPTLFPVEQYREHDQEPE